MYRAQPPLNEPLLTARAAKNCELLADGTAPETTRRPGVRGLWRRPLGEHHE